MRKRIYFIWVAMFFSCVGFGQPEILSNMVQTQKSTIHRDYLRDGDTRIVVSSHYASKYVESNYQYRQYLNFLTEIKNDSLLAAAQPNRGIWDLTNLKNKEKVFLKKNYWSDERFNDYPVLGLNFTQVNNYLKWKSEFLNIAYLIFLGKINNTILDVKNNNKIEQQTKNNIDIPKESFYFPSLRLFTFHELATSHQNGGTSSHINDIDKIFSKWLSKNEQFQFLIYEPKPLILKDSPIYRKINKLGILPVVYSNINNLRGINNYGQFELVMDWINMEKSKSGERVNSSEQNWENRIVVSFKYKKGRINKAKKMAMTAYPFFVFRTCMTNINKK
ncbi:MAG: hypothetical protein R2788_26245 [Saprospiraceae bacterium]